MRVTHWVTDAMLNYTYTMQQQEIFIGSWRKSSMGLFIDYSIVRAFEFARQIECQVWPNRLPPRAVWSMYEAKCQKLKKPPRYLSPTRDRKVTEPFRTAYNRTCSRQSSSPGLDSHVAQKSIYWVCGASINRQ
jgi:hypothetical protein